MVKYVLMMTWCPPKMLQWYKWMILSTQLSGIAMTADSFLCVDVSLNNYESSSKYLSANVLVLKSALYDDKLYCTKHKYTSLKYGLLKYPTWTSFSVTGKCIPFNTFLCIIFNVLSKSSCLGKHLCTKFCHQLCVHIRWYLQVFLPGVSYI